MKRIFSVLMIALMAISLTSCDWFKKDEQPVNEQPTVESYIESDMEYMLANYDSTYAWYETEIIYKDFLDAENDGTYESIKSVYQYEKITDTGTIVNAVTIWHVGDSTAVEVVDTWYAECFDLRESEICITFKDAYDAIMSVNLPKPHTRCCVLRDQVGPVAANPQYIYGQGYLFVDAFSGEVSEINPVFPNSDEVEGEVAKDTVQ